MGMYEIEAPTDLVDRLGGPEAAGNRILKAARYAIRTCEKPTQLHSDSNTPVRLRIPASDESRLKKYQSQLSNPPDIPTLVVQLAQTQTEDKPESKSLPKGTAADRWISGPREDQHALCSAMQSAETLNRILLLEASTGIGKGRALCAFAADYVTRKSERIVIAAPTVRVLTQLYFEHISLLDSKRPEAACVIGLDQFVSETALRDLLRSEEGMRVPDASLASCWLDEESFIPWGPLEKSWLVASLQAKAPKFPVRLVKLNHHKKRSINPSEDRGLASYLSCIEDSHEASIVFCTHTMLAIDTMARRRNATGASIAYTEKDRYQTYDEWSDADHLSRIAENPTGVLPDYSALLVDEAHLLHSNFSAAAADEISLFSLKTLIQKHGTPALKKRVRRVFSNLVKVGRCHKSIEVGPGASSHIGESVTDELKSLVIAVQRSLTKIGSTEARESLKAFADSMFWLKDANAWQSSYVSSLLFTPVRGFPILCRKKRSVRRDLQFLWHLSKSATLTSATLYRNTTSGYCARDLTEQLAIPITRLSTHAPLRPEWTTTPVHCYLPSDNPNGATSQGFTPPKFDSSPEAWSEYYNEISSWMISTFNSKHSGGCLVLMTSYDGASQLHKRLSASPLGSRVLVSTPEESFDLTSKRYMESVKQGLAPIWLSVGRSWYGLNLTTGETPDEDHAIDYLVIPRAPFLMNASPLEREEFLNVQKLNTNRRNEIYRAHRMIRQGLGRLVRQPGVGRKEVFVLDGRIIQKRGGIFAQLRSAFSEYVNQHPLPLPRPIG